MYCVTGFSPKGCTSLLVVGLAISACRSLEDDDRPEVLLSTLNFDLGPYRTGYEGENDASTRTGPVLFPETPPEPANENAYVGLPADGSPYEGVARKRKYQQRAGRFRIKESPSGYGDAVEDNVLEELPSEKSYQRQKYSEKKNNYAFGYKVLDYKSGDDFSHSQSGNSHATKGEYRVKLPDGRVQIVSYTADKNGYNAVVKYEDDANAKQTQRNDDAPYEPPQITDQTYIYVPSLQPLQLSELLFADNHRHKRIKYADAPLAYVDFANTYGPQQLDDISRFIYGK